jgi:hypothetical protein
VQSRDCFTPFGGCEAHAFAVHGELDRSLIDDIGRVDDWWFDVVVDVVPRQRWQLAACLRIVQAARVRDLLGVRILRRCDVP